MIGIGMISTVIFGLLTIVAALVTIHMEGAFNTMVEWYAAILGPISIPMLFGMIFRKPTWRGAILSWAAGFVTFGLVKYGLGAITGTEIPFALYTGLELFVSFAVFYFEGYINEQTDEEKMRVNELFERISDNND